MGLISTSSVAQAGLAGSRSASAQRTTAPQLRRCSPGSRGAHRPLGTINHITDVCRVVGDDLASRDQRPRAPQGKRVLAAAPERADGCSRWHTAGLESRRPRSAPWKCRLQAACGDSEPRVRAQCEPGAPLGSPGPRNPHFYGDPPLANGGGSFPRYEPATRLRFSAIGGRGISAARFALRSAGSYSKEALLRRGFRRFGAWTSEVRAGRIRWSRGGIRRSGAERAIFVA